MGAVTKEGAEMKKRLLIFFAVVIPGFALLALIAWCVCGPDAEPAWLAHTIVSAGSWTVSISAACLAFKYGGWEP